MISDIDDTIKITEIPAGKRIVAVNTFLRDFFDVREPIPIIEKYKELAARDGAAFHYVSGGPWQLYQPL